MTIDYDKIFDRLESGEETIVENEEELLTGVEWKKEDKAEELVFYPKLNVMTRRPDEVESNVFNLEIAKSKLDADNVHELVARADSLVVETDEDAKRGITLAMEARKMGNSIERARKSIIRPHLDFNKAVRTYAEEFSTCLKKMETSLLEKVEVYQDQRKAGLEEVGIIDDSFDNISVDEGSSKTVSKWEYSVTNIDNVPKEYLQIDDKAVKDAVKNGIRNIPGLNIFETKKKQYRVK